MQEFTSYLLKHFRVETYSLYDPSREESVETNVYAMIGNLLINRMIIDEDIYEREICRIVWIDL